MKKLLLLLLCVPLMFSCGDNGSKIKTTRNVPKCSYCGEYYEFIKEEPQDPGRILYQYHVCQNMKDGQGTYVYPNGNKYIGEWKDGKKHGQGTMTYMEEEHYGKVYVGEWKDNMKHGQGKITELNGTVKEGLWENDKFIGE